jgi:DNA-binding transcriptional MocR family regulator
MMYDMFAHYYLFGVLDKTPWCCLEDVKWICPVPGYDRHFSITEAFGVEMINVPMLEGGPDMDMVEELVANDRSIKGIWCVPKYANPTGTSYSDETVRRLAGMRCAAPDFRIFWDNAYVVHHLYDDPSQQDQLLDIGEACRDAGYPNRYVKFASLSKITFPGASISAFGCSFSNMREAKKRMAAQTIGFDKLNQLRHVRFFRNAEGVREQMRRHAAILRPKFDIVVNTFARELTGIAEWGNPRGGYFVSLNVPDGCAKRVYGLMKDAGVTLTEAGATYPYGIDPRDRNLRIAPTYPTCEELQTAIDILCVCVKLAAAEKEVQA